MWFRLLGWGWLAVSAVLMWWPLPGRTTAATIEWLGNGFHALWFALGGMIAGRGWRRVGLASLWFALTALGAGFEFGQYWVVGRNPSWIDAVLNTIGAGGGLWVASRLQDAEGEHGDAVRRNSDRVDRRLGR